MARHRGRFNRQNPAPYELSRSRVENYLKCKACFWLEQLHRVKPPEIPSFTINTTTDILLKRDADAVRGRQTLPLWAAHGLDHLIPFEHEHLEKWTNSLHYGANDTYFNTVHTESNIKFGGGLDDVFLNTRTGQIHIVDYKSTAQGTRSPIKYEKKPVSLNDPWKISYKRQMDMYVWVMRRKGFSISSIGYFLYCDGDRFSEYNFLNSENASMQFKMSLIPYRVDTGWIEPTLLSIKECLYYPETPRHAENCEYGKFLRALQFDDRN